MIKQLCRGCGKITWHNESGKKENPPREPRCTYCGTPVKTGLSREYWQSIQNKQLAKAGR